MNNINEILRELPKVTELLDELCAGMPEVPRSVIKQSIQQEIDSQRRDIISGNRDSVQLDILKQNIELAITEKKKYKLRQLINATGVVLHTNLGRAPLSDEAAKQMGEISRGYSNLEFDLETGIRGERYDHVEELICSLTGAEAALTVNNNAAAVLLALTSLAEGREVIVSRGELVEIGGSFRVPEVMEAGGCILREVGSTNKTKVQDYRAAVGENTAALLKVHTSNYKIIGFTQSVELWELSSLGREYDLPVMYDLGCGLFADLKAMGVGTEPTVQECIPFADVVCFSGDKLLGGPQTGIIAGKAQYINPMKSHQLLRALRVDKLTLSALEITLRSYLDMEKALREVPVMRMITQSLDEIRSRAEGLIEGLSDEFKYGLKITDTLGQIGGGTMPEVTLPSVALSIEPGEFGKSPDSLSKELRRGEIPVIGRIEKDTVLLDMRTVNDEDIPKLRQSVGDVLRLR